jgi:hypothetical protein
MLYRKKVKDKHYIAEGVQQFTFSDGSKMYNSTEYIWSQSRSIKDKELKRITVKSGIDGYNFTPGEFLKSKKRDNIDKEIIMFRKDPIPSSWNEVQVYSYLNLKDEFFNDSMKEYRFDKVNTNAGTEIFFFDESIDVKDFIAKKWDIARNLAKNQIMGITALKKKALNTFKLRFDQPDVVAEILKTLTLRGLCIGELAMGYGKGAIFYAVAKARKRLFNIFVSNSIKNTAQLAQAHYFYSSADSRVLSNPMIVCSENRYTRSCVKKTGMKHFPVERGENKVLVEELKYAKENNIPTNIFVTYQSSQGLHSILKELNITNCFLGEDEIDTIAGKHIESEYCSSIRNKDLFKDILRLSGTLVSRPNSNTGSEIYYNSDDFVNNQPDVLRSEKYCRENGFIADQRVLILRFNPANEELNTLASSNNQVLLSDINSTMRADKLFILIGLKKAMALGRKRIHIPVSKTSTTRRTILAIKRAQERGELDPKYKVIRALIHDGDEALEDFNENCYSIVIGTRWMNRGVDTVNLDTTIHTTEYSSYQSATQTKGRGHRLSSEKEYHLNILCQTTNRIETTIMYEVIQKNSTNSGYEIIGPDITLDVIDTDTDLLDIVTREERVEEAIETNGIVIEQMDEETAAITSTLNNLCTAIDEGYLIDKEGNDNFRDIVGKLTTYFDSELLLAAAEYSSFSKFRKEKANLYLAIKWRGEEFKEQAYAHMLDYQLKKNFKPQHVVDFIKKHNLKGKNVTSLYSFPKIEPDFSGIGYGNRIIRWNKDNPNNQIDLIELGMVKRFTYPSCKENVLPEHFDRARLVVKEFAELGKTHQDLYEQDPVVWNFFNKYSDIDKEVKFKLKSREYKGSTKRKETVKKAIEIMKKYTEVKAFRKEQTRYYCAIQNYENKLYKEHFNLK